MGCWAEYKRDKNVNTFCLTFYVQNLMDNLQYIIGKGSERQKNENVKSQKKNIESQKEHQKSERRKSFLDF